MGTNSVTNVDLPSLTSENLNGEINTIVTSYQNKLILIIKISTWLNILSALACTNMKYQLLDSVMIGALISSSSTDV